jgi:hypothetical protein
MIYLLCSLTLLLLPLLLLFPLQSISWQLGTTKVQSVE